MRRLLPPVYFGQLVLAVMVLFLARSGSSVAQMATYRFDKEYTAINFSWSHLGLSRQSARLSGIDGRIQFDPMTPELGTVDVTIKAASIWTGVPAFDQIIKSADYFNVAQFPLISFRSREVRRTSDKTGQVLGDLTVKGITRPATLEVVWNFAGEHPLARINPNYRDMQVAGFSATAVLRRSDWDMSLAIPLVSDEVRVSIETELVRTE